MKTKQALWAIVALSVSLASCSSGKNSEGGGAPAASAPVKGDSVSEFPYEIVTKNKVSAENAELLESLKTTKTVSHRKITERLMDQSIAKYVKDRAKNVRGRPMWHGVAAVEQMRLDAEVSREHLDAAVDGLRANDPHKFKVNYEARLQAIVGTELKYNIDSDTLAETLLSGELQCYSGTLLNLAATRKLLTASEIRDEHHVVIVTSGHVQPGYLVERAHQWHLYGIETTVKGRGIVYYGPTSGITQPLRLASTEHFAIFEVIQNDIKNNDELATAIFSAAASKYGLNQVRIEKVKSKKVAGSRGSPMFFGVADVKSGARDRAEFDNNVSGDGLTFKDPQELRAEEAAERAALAAAQNGLVTESAVHAQAIVAFKGVNRKKGYGGTIQLATPNLHIPTRTGTISPIPNHYSMFPHSYSLARSIKFESGDCYAHISWIDGATQFLGQFTLPATSVMPEVSALMLTIPPFKVTGDEVHQTFILKACTSLVDDGDCPSGITFELGSTFNKKYQGGYAIESKECVIRPF